MQVILFLLVGGTLGYLLAPSMLLHTRHGDLVFNAGFILPFVGWFLLGGFLSTMVRLVGPKREHIITFLGTFPLQRLTTGIRLTLPWPLGLTHMVVHTEVHSKQVKVQVKSEDNLVFTLPVTIQYQVEDGMKFAIERDHPEKQMENLTVAAVRAAANALKFEDIYKDKDKVKKDVDSHIANQLATFGVKILELVIEDPELPEPIAKSLNSIRQAEYDRQAAVSQAKATYERMVGEARASAESTLLKGDALAGFRLKIAEGNAAAIAVMQGKLSIKWEEKTVGTGDNAKTIQVATFEKPKRQTEQGGQEGGVVIPEIDIDPESILSFFKIVDSNDAIRDAAGKKGTLIITPVGGGSSDLANMAAAMRALGDSADKKAA